MMATAKERMLELSELPGASIYTARQHFLSITQTGDGETIYVPILETVDVEVDTPVEVEVILDGEICVDVELPPDITIEVEVEEVTIDTTYTENEVDTE